MNVCDIMALVLLVSFVDLTQSRGLKEYCFPDAFNASCGHRDVIFVESARYGRMREGTCLTTSLHVGCWADVLSQVDRKCSGRHGCAISIPDTTLHNLQPCPKDMFAYLEASYICLPIAYEPTWSCHPQTSLDVPAPPGYLSSMATMETGLGSRTCPWRVTVLPGQRINVTLVDFGVAARQTQSGSVCQVYAKIREQGMASEITICGGQSRQRGVYVSETNEIDVMILTSHEDNDPVYFVLKYDVVGCTDPPVPKGAWLKRSGDKAVIGCNYTTQAWHIVCHGNEWFGKLENCTVVSTDPQSDGLASSKGLMVAVVTGLVLGVLIGVALLAMVIVCHKRKQRGSRAMTERVPQEDTIDSVQGTPFLHDCKPNKPQDTLDSGYGYTHVCDVTIYQPYQQRQMTSFLKEGDAQQQEQQQQLHHQQQQQQQQLQQQQLLRQQRLYEQEHYERPGLRKASLSTPVRDMCPPEYPAADTNIAAAAHRIIYPGDNRRPCTADH